MFIPAGTFISDSRVLLRTYYPSKTLTSFISNFQSFRKCVPIIGNSNSIHGMIIRVPLLFNPNTWEKLYILREMVPKY